MMAWNVLEIEGVQTFVVMGGRVNREETLTAILRCNRSPVPVPLAEFQQRNMHESIHRNHQDPCPTGTW